MRYPNFNHEKALAADGHTVVLGVDEVGCGSLAGPVIAAAVSLPLNLRIKDIKDSKLLSGARRKKVVERFCGLGISWTIGMATCEEVDQHNVRRASLLAMKRAIDAYEGATFALIDAWNIPGLEIPQRGIIRGDFLVKSIAAASIVAKVVRDRLMEEFDEEFPHYGFRVHKGYATRTHRTALLKWGPCPLHRRTFLKKLYDNAQSLF